MKIRVDDIQMYYETLGEGSPLLLIMGFLGNADCWDPIYFLPKLSERFKLVMFDNRGAGRTDLSGKEYSIRLFADDTVGLMDALGIERAHVLGISMGGMIAQELAINYPEKVEKLVLASTACGVEKFVQALGEKNLGKQVKVAQAMVEIPNALSEKGGWDEEIARKFISLVFTEEFARENPGAVDASVKLVLTAPTPLEGATRQVFAVLNLNACDRLPQIKAPTLILAGKRDVLVPPENAEVMAKLIPNSRVAYFENSGHMLEEEIEKVANTVLEFLTAPEAEPI